jgi:two-component system chemotaxis response regulator CheB
MNDKIKVLIVDDSAVVRQVLRAILERDPGIRVIGAAADPIFAQRRMNKEWPDVIVLDIDMPRMDGITFLKKIMAEHPTPVVICSKLTQRRAIATVQAMEGGAVNIIAKPEGNFKQFLNDSAADLIMAVKEAAQANVSRLKPALASMPKAEPKLTADAIMSAAGTRAVAQTTERIVAIGTSAGGTQALEVLLPSLPRDCPGIVVVQHMPEDFTAAFAARLNSLCKIEVREARNNDQVIPGLALIAPGGKHMLLKRSNSQYHVEVVDGPVVNRHRPSVDVLFRSVAKYAGKNATGIIMTGMGDDGARGLKEMHDAGAQTVAQDEESCVVYGMPKEAIKLGGVDRVMGLQDIHGAILARET